MTDDPETRTTAAAPHKTRSESRQAPSGRREVFLTVEHGTQGGRTLDIEGAVVVFDGQSITFEYEDGDRFVFDATELRATLDDAA